MNNSKRQQKQTGDAQSRALVKQDQNNVVAPITDQPGYLVPESDESILAAQTASWDTSSEIKILRYYLAKCAKDGGSATTAVLLTKALDTMIARNQATALRCGSYLSRDAIRDFVFAIIQVACESVRSRVPDEIGDEIIDEMRAKLMPMCAADTIAAANVKRET